MEYFNEICGHCGFTYGSHYAGTRPWPMNYCPATEGGMDFAQGPGTIFKPTGKYIRSKDVPAIYIKDSKHGG